ncbi:MAG: NUDIX domain-containing protein [Bacteroidota bacterium]
MKRFNVRVYGVCIENDHLLVTDEIRLNTKMTKLPGGGLEFGEGLEDALKREFMEEMEAEIEVGNILYVNPFLQISVFRETDQVLCLYFLVSRRSEIKGIFTEKALDFPTEENDQQQFRWVPMQSLRPETFTFPIDQALVPQLLAHYDIQKKLDQSQ